MIDGMTLQLIMRLLAAILTLWFASIAIRREHVMWPFAPLIIYAIALDMAAAGDFYQIFLSNFHTIMDALFLAAYMSMLLVIVSVHNKRL